VVPDPGRHHDESYRCGLVSLASVQSPCGTEADVDRRLKSFIPAISPTLEAYRPSRHARLISAAASPGRKPT
jgi:hypothetical protein